MRWIPLALLALLGWMPVADEPLPEGVSHVVAATALKSKFSFCLQDLAVGKVPSSAICEALAVQAAREYEAALAAEDVPQKTKTMIFASLGDLYREQGKHEEALANFQKCLDLSPDNLYALEGHARAAEALGKWEEAASGYRTLIDRKPGESDVVLRLATIYATAPDTKVRNPQEAVKLAKKVTDLRGGTDPEALAVYAEALFASGDTLSAIDVIQRAIVLAREPTRYRQALGRYQKAHYEKVLPPAPKSEQIPLLAVPPATGAGPQPSPAPSSAAPAASTAFPQNKGSLE